jgi:hypothetical protein
MKKLLTLAALPILAFTMAGCAHPAPPPPPPPPPAYAPPPPGAIARNAYRDGVLAARRDMTQGLPPQVERHPRFRNPPTPPGEPVNIYRRNFRNGYRATYAGR